MRTESQRGSSVKQATPEWSDSDGQEMGQVEFLRPGAFEFCTATCPGPVNLDTHKALSLPNDTCPMPNARNILNQTHPTNPGLDEGQPLEEDGDQ